MWASHWGTHPGLPTVAIVLDLHFSSPPYPPLCLLQASFLLKSDNSACVKVAVGFHENTSLSTHSPCNTLRFNRVFGGPRFNLREQFQPQHVIIWYISAVIKHFWWLLLVTVKIYYLSQSCRESSTVDPIWKKQVKVLESWLIASTLPSPCQSQQQNFEHVFFEPFIPVK